MPYIGEEERRHCFLSGKNCPHADEAANNAVRKVFAILGVDIDKPESVAEFQESLRFGRKLSKGATYGFFAVIGIITTSIMAALWAGIVNKLGGH